MECKAAASDQLWGIPLQKQCNCRQQKERRRVSQLCHVSKVAAGQGSSRAEKQKSEQRKRSASSSSAVIRRARERTEQKAAEQQLQRVELYSQPARESRLQAATATRESAETRYRRRAVIKMGGGKTRQGTIKMVVRWRWYLQAGLWQVCESRMSSAVSMKASAANGHARNASQGA
ncbi:hypothetical protein HPP92_021824 [Vanilla planifolia]|uniref:Uncharacterized protein n=1 Tax=Vanilla planifolia TaxID=51239 RepID=A0A835PQY4_VANPL|nr:hypothetical protein HPP92_022147 [Vanilla planifolia]KAG0458696.1 hypothetical protein HPP92_021824 [Vanilla planifolia]